MTKLSLQEKIKNTRRWARALESSKKYKDGLADGRGRYCCLGVGCKVLRQKTDLQMCGNLLPADINVNLVNLTILSGFYEQAEMTSANDNCEVDIIDYDLKKKKDINFSKETINKINLEHIDLALYLYLRIEEEKRKI